MKALEVTSTLNENCKKEATAGLRGDCMSPENSESERENDAVDSSDEEDQSTTTKRKIVVRPLPWRSDKYNELMNTLDRKWFRRSSEKSRGMMKPRFKGAPLRNSEPPADIPAWIRK